MRPLLLFLLVMLLAACEAEHPATDAGDDLADAALSKPVLAANPLPMKQGMVPGYYATYVANWGTDSGQINLVLTSKPYPGSRKLTAVYWGPSLAMRSEIENVLIEGRGGQTEMGYVSQREEFNLPLPAVMPLTDFVHAGNIICNGALLAGEPQLVKRGSYQDSLGRSYRGQLVYQMKGCEPLGSLDSVFVFEAHALVNDSLDYVHRYWISREGQHLMSQLERPHAPSISLRRTDINLARTRVLAAMP